MRQSRRADNKHHIILPLARPLPIDPHRKKEYRQQFGWILGVLSEIAGLSGYFDYAADRLLQLCICYTRRDAAALKPETAWQEGAALDWEAFLRETGFTFATTSPFKRLFAAGGVTVRAFQKAGLYSHRIDAEKHAVICPWASEHSSDTDGSSSTVVWHDANTFFCAHAHCRGRTADDVYRALPGVGRDVLDAEALPEIVLSADEFTVTEQTEAALGERCPSLYQRGGGLVHVVSDASPLAAITRPAGTSRIVPAPPAWIREQIARYTHLQRHTDDGAERAHPPAWLVQSVTDRGEWSTIRTLEAIVTNPILRTDGSIHATPGYDARSGLLYAPPSGIIPGVPEQPTRLSARIAARVLCGLVRDFPFRSPAHRAAWLAALLTLAGRYAFPGPSPLFLVDANVRGAGKSLLADLLSIIATGRPAARMAHVEDDAEMRKRITALAVEGCALTLIDNVEGRLGGPSLNAALTSVEWSDRILGSTRTVRVPLYTTWLATGNNVALDGDTTRRTLHIRLDSPAEKPEERSGFRYPSIVDHVSEHREWYVAAALTILSAYCQAGKPFQARVRPWGSFDGWSRLIRHALVWCGQSDPGETREALAERADSERGFLEVMIDGLAELDPDGNGRTSEQIVSAAAKRITFTTPQYPSLASALAELSTARGAITPRSLGMRLGHVEDRVVGGKCIRSRTVRGTKFWYVDRVASAPHVNVRATDIGNQERSL